MTAFLAPRRNVLGVGISEIDTAAATECVLAAARSGAKLGVSALAVHAVMEGRKSPEFRARLNSLDIAAPDGQPVRWALNTLHHSDLAERVYGPFLMGRVCAAAAQERIPIFLMGSCPATLGKLALGLCAAHRGLRIAGTLPSRFRRISKAEAMGDADLIGSSGARIVFCGLGCPRQEAWVHAMSPFLQIPLIGVGAAFALGASERTMAPSWMQRSGLEWLYRLGQEPRRLAGRYLLQQPRFFVDVALQKMGREPPSAQPREVAADYWG